MPELEHSVLYGKLSNLALTIDDTSQIKLEIHSTIVFVMLLTGLLPITDFSWCTSIARREWRRERETIIYRAENVTGIAWHLLGVRKTEEKQTRRLSQVVALKGGLLMSVAFFRPPNHRVPEGSVPTPLPHPLSRFFAAFPLLWATRTISGRDGTSRLHRLSHSSPEDQDAFYWSLTSHLRRAYM